MDLNQMPRFEDLPWYAQQLIKDNEELKCQLEEQRIQTIADRPSASLMARWIQVSTATITRAAQRGDFKAYHCKPLNRWFVDVDSCLKWAKRFEDRRLPLG